MATILHLISEQDWETARSAGQWRPPSLDQEGFIHGSSNLDQVLRVAHRLYAGRADMLVLEVETERLTQPLVVEPSRSGELYPHIYGPLDNSAVQRVLKLQLDEQGRFSIPEI